MSQKENFFNAYCETNDAFDDALNIQGSTLLAYPNQIMSCGGILNDHVTNDCYSLDPSIITWQLTQARALLKGRAFAAMAKTPNGDWVISGGFTDVPTHASHSSTKTVEMINLRKHQFEADLTFPTAQHCLVHYHCFYFFYGGGTGSFSDIALSSAYFHNFKTGNYHVLEPMKVPRSNHVCFATAQKGKARRVSSLTLIVRSIRNLIHCRFLLLEEDVGWMGKMALRSKF